MREPLEQMKKKDPRFFIAGKNKKIMNGTIEIGNIVKEKLKEKDLKIAWLARQVHCDESNFCKKLKNNDINNDLLYRISEILHEDFFAYFSNELNKKW